MTGVPDYLRRLVIEGEGDPDRVQAELTLCLIDVTERRVEAEERIAEALTGMPASEDLTLPSWVNGEYRDDRYIGTMASSGPEKGADDSEGVDPYRPTHRRHAAVWAAQRRLSSPPLLQRLPRCCCSWLSWPLQGLCKGGFVANPTTA